MLGMSRVLNGILMHEPHDRILKRCSRFWKMVQGQEEKAGRHSNRLLLLLGRLECPQLLLATLCLLKITISYY